MQVFKKLRNRLLLTNVTLITVLMFAVFISIYLITYNQVLATINKELITVSSPWVNAGGKYIRIPGGPDADAAHSDQKKELPEIDTSLPDRSIAFTIFTNTDGEIHKIYSFFDIESTFYLQALDMVIDQGTDRGKIIAEEYVWEYLIQRTEDWVIYNFLDITSKQAMLDRLVLTLLLAAAIAMSIIFLLSYFLANRAILPVKDAFNKQKQFITNASHELKTPITIISADIDLLLKSNLPAEDEKWLSLIRIETDNMTRLTNELLSLTRIETEDALYPAAEYFNLTRVIEGILLGAEGLVYEKGRHLEYSLEADIHYKGVKQSIIQIVRALLDNAVKYSDPGGLIKVRLQKNRKNIVFEISNLGEGIPAEDLPFIFDRFYRVDKSRNREGGSFGLGLAITKLLVDHENGIIKCSSTVGEETVFTVFFKF